MTWNVNGLRAALRKGFYEHVERIQPDVILLQEIRVQPEQLPAQWVKPAGWHVLWHPATRLGYAGTAVWSRYPIKMNCRGLDGAADPDGRLLCVQIGGIDMMSVYLPSGSHSEERQQMKEVWMKEFEPWAARLMKQRRPVILGGDFNIAHTEQDIFYAKSNANTSGFLPHEREWFSRLLASGWRDLVREHYGPMQGPYSWWSNRGQARKLDRGWRIDYLLSNKALAKRFMSAQIHREGGLTVSDHAPVTIDVT